ncbi:hypothetical protein [Shouchella shacheensis]|uniref:hypothetical protein n=1 Tax=Shouchella shacheensis TaxID=1649580 RepID=UPI00073FEA59|nr:hypothetical protein [Shouchella shacheensis]
MGKNNQNSNWVEAKKRCRLNQADIQMAKELGMKPKSLLKNIPSPTQQWKAPVKVWIRDLYEKKFGRVRLLEKTKAIKESSSKEKRESYPEKREISDEELPF